MKYTPTKFMKKTSHYDKNEVDLVVSFIEQLKHTKGEFYGEPFKLLPCQQMLRGNPDLMFPVLFLMNCRACEKQKIF